MKDDVVDQEENKSTTSHLSQQQPRLCLPQRRLHHHSFDTGITSITSTSSLCYTSLRDLISSASSSADMKSPESSAPAISACYQIPIRNRLVKQAAWAYLQPRSSSSSFASSRSQLLFSRLWDCVSSLRPLEGFAEYLMGVFSRLYRNIHDQIGDAVRWLIVR